MAASVCPALFPSLPANQLTETEQPLFFFRHLGVLRFYLHHVGREGGGGGEGGACDRAAALAARAPGSCCRSIGRFARCEKQRGVDRDVLTMTMINDVYVPLLTGIR